MNIKTFHPIDKLEFTAVVFSVQFELAQGTKRTQSVQYHKQLVNSFQQWRYVFKAASRIIELMNLILKSSNA